MATSEGQPKARRFLGLPPGQWGAVGAALAVLAQAGWEGAGWLLGAPGRLATVEATAERHERELDAIRAILAENAKQLAVQRATVDAYVAEGREMRQAMATDRERASADRRELRQKLDRLLERLGTGQP